MDNQCVTSSSEVLGPAGLRREQVHINAWGKSIWMRELTLAERLDIEPAAAAASDDNKEANMGLFLRMLISSAETPDRQPLFGPDDMEALRQSSGAAIYEAGMAALRINRMMVDDVEGVKKT